MGKSGKKDSVAKARKKVALAQNRYMKAVAKGEREIRNVRALADERIARAKAEFEMRAGELADIEQRNAANGDHPHDSAADVMAVSTKQTNVESRSTPSNGASHRSAATTKSASKSAAPAKGRTKPADLSKATSRSTTATRSAKPKTK
jgi:hypothetical protein